MRLDRARVRELMALVVATRDVPLPDDDAVALRDIGFRSLDFSELALRVEDEIDRELNFDAPGLRSVVTIGDVLEPDRPAAGRFVAVVGAASRLVIDGLATTWAELESLPLPGNPPLAVLDDGHGRALRAVARHRRDGGELLIAAAGRSTPSCVTGCSPTASIS